MAQTVKKTTETKATVKEIPVVKEKVKTEGKKETTVKKEETVAKQEVKKAIVKKTATTTSKAPVKKEVKATSVVETNKPEDIKATVTLQFAEKSYTRETLMNIAKDVWKYDLNQNEDDLNTVELYVKPEENLCYYVFNIDITGSFGI